ncbi:hypothetical protein HOLleu_11471 [Holothuria leucospilota]|uniref:Endonuclease n=1 Tax=Holothuria leucospilota TaxID=206669 RepID=A0A9Q1HF64_HOLLE|nr:hypothetical protein HOLleu_11471 [Holothuria leucospilota]
MEASGHSKKEESVKTAILLNLSGEDAVEIYNSFKWDKEEDSKILEEVLKKFESYCNPRKNVTWERHVFNTRVQQPSESIDQYVTDLKLKSKSCEFGPLRDDLIRDRIVCGIRDDNVKRRLLREAKLTLQTALDICRASEVTLTQMKTLSSEKAVLVAAKSTRSRPTSKPGKNTSHKSLCGRCGNKRHRSEEDCPAMGELCRNCKRPNHFAKVCRTKKDTGQYSAGRNVSSVQQMDNDDTTDGNEFFVGVTNTPGKPLKNNSWTVNLSLESKTVTVQIDTGAQCNVMSQKTYSTLSKERLIKVKDNLVGFGGQKLRPIGRTQLECSYKSKFYVLEFFVTKENVPTLLGQDSLEELNLVKRIYSAKSETVDIMSEFDDVFTGLGCVKDVIHHIMVDPDVPPVVHPPRKVPVALRAKVKEELKRMEELDVIEKVTSPTQWVSSMVSIFKNDKVRICLDPKDLNKAIRREHFPMRTVEDVVSQMPNAKVFSVLDASSGFWQIKLDKESSKLCTFNSPNGRYMFKRLPFGISSAPEVFQSVMSQVFDGIEGVEIVADDILVWGEDDNQHEHRLRQVLERARHMNVKLNKSKCQLRKSEIAYLGHVVGKEGLKIDQEKVRAITEMEAPTDKAGLQRFMGMVTYVSKFIPNLSQVSAPLRILLKKDVQWHWEENQEESFQNIKSIVSNTPVLKLFDVTKPVTLSVDASSQGLGAVILQDDQPVAYASRALTTSQKNYAQIEKEMLAIVFGCEKFQDFLFGQERVTVESDHKPLEAIFKKSLHETPHRLQQMLLRIQKYSLNVMYKPGTDIPIADALSRAFLKEENNCQNENDFEIDIIQLMPISEAKFKELQEATQADPTLQELRKLIESEWPSTRAETPLCVRPYWNIRNEISLNDNIVMRGDRFIVPKVMRSEMLKLIHNAHLGIETCKRRARDVLYWPQMNSDIEDVVTKCGICNKYQKSNMKEPLMPHEVPERPWAQIGGDLFEFNRVNYLILVDYYSGFFEISKLYDTRSSTIISQCKSQFARHGIPDKLITDNGPQFASSEFAQFAQQYNFTHMTSSPYHPQSNGMAERSVQTVKSLLRKALDDNNDPYLALLDFRNTPRDDTLGSPAQRLFGRRTKTLIPTSRKLLEPKTIQPQQVTQGLTKRRQKQKVYFDRNTRKLPQLKIGDSVRVQTDRGWFPAIVKGTASTPRSYIVQTPDGARYTRNRKHLRQTNETFVEEDDLEPFSQDTDPGTTETTSTTKRKRQRPFWHKDYVMT